MRIRVLNDLHLEFEDFRPPPVEADVVVLAGDIHVGRRALPWIREHFESVPVVYVLGNHEYYREAIPKLVSKLEEEAATLGEVHVLEESAVDIGGVRFVGCTLWTDLALHGDAFESIAAVADRMTDYRVIRVSPTYRHLRAADTIAWHRRARAWLKDELSRTERPTVVVTHHAPSPQSLSPKRLAQSVSAAYASNLESMIEDHGPALWIHGHVHECSDYRVGRTRVVCNPRGYPDEPCPDFDPELCIELDC